MKPPKRTNFKKEPTAVSPLGGKTEVRGQKTYKTPIQILLSALCYLSSGVFYSYRSDNTGLRAAARSAIALTVSNATNKAAKLPAAKYPHDSSI